MASAPELLWEVLDEPEVLEVLELADALLEAAVGAELGVERLLLLLLAEEEEEELVDVGVEVAVELPLLELLSGSAPMIPKVPTTPAAAMPIVAMVVLAMPRRGS